MQIQQTVSDIEGFKYQQVVAPKGLDISCPTMLVLYNFFLKGQN